MNAQGQINWISHKERKEVNKFHYLNLINKLINLRYIIQTYTHALWEGQLN